MRVELIDCTDNIELKIAKAAGICYDSNVDNPKQLVRRLKADGHLATFRFGYVTFRVSDFSRSCSMQMLRHKFLEYLQRSQRYVKEFQFEYVTPHSISENSAADYAYRDLMERIQETYDDLIQMGIKAEDARYVLPNSCYTKMNVIGSVQAWWDFLYGDAGRLQKAAQWEIREVAQEIEKHLNILAPNIFGGKDV